MFLFLAVILAVLAVFGYVVGVYNGLIAMKNNIEKAWKNIDVVLQQRYSELPKLVDVCKGYMKHEFDTLTRITELRSGAQSPGASTESKIAAENQLEKIMGQLRVTVEKYPDLKANQEFLKIMERVSALESKIADSRELFNETANTYNINIQRFPAFIVAGLLRFTEQALLEVPEEFKKDVKIQF
ncbi:MAG: hypothetical protein A2297_04530 [Elusimicrobia bacterium RIFOXYB2_FULL_48_7]|nr:MAG: hypothetical protein A2297_04530 [Elusimicrobia bacterium RIFOXYB2_FULL_48_7]